MPTSARAAYSGDLARGAGEQVLAPEHVGDPHQRVVERVHERVERVAVGAGEGVVGHVVAVEGDPAPHEVVEDDVALGHPEPRHRRSPLGLERRHLLGGEVAAEPVVAHVLGAGRLAPGGDLVGGAVAAVGVAARGQPLQRVAVEGAALGLAVRRVRAADVRPLVPGQPEPAEEVEQAVVRLLGVAGRVGVLDPEHEGAAVVACEGPVEQHRPDQADVRTARRGRRESDADRTISHGRRPYS